MKNKNKSMLILNLSCVDFKNNPYLLSSQDIEKEKKNIEKRQKEIQ